MLTREPLKLDGLVFGDNVVRRRLLMGLGQRELARKAGIGAQTLNAIEGGKRPNISPPTTRKIAEALDTTIAKLYGVEEE